MASAKFANFLGGIGKAMQAYAETSSYLREKQRQAEQQAIENAVREKTLEFQKRQTESSIKRNELEIERMQREARYEAFNSIMKIENPYLRQQMLKKLDEKDVPPAFRDFWKGLFSGTQTVTIQVPKEPSQLAFPNQPGAPIAVQPETPRNTGMWNIDRPQDNLLPWEFAPPPGSSTPAPASGQTPGLTPLPGMTPPSGSAPGPIAPPPPPGPIAPPPGLVSSPAPAESPAMERREIQITTPAPIDLVELEKKYREMEYDTDARKRVIEYDRMIGNDEFGAVAEANRSFALNIINTRNYYARLAGIPEISVDSITPTAKYRAEVDVLNARTANFLANAALAGVRAENIPQMTRLAAQRIAEMVRHNMTMESIAKERADISRYRAETAAQAVDIMGMDVASKITQRAGELGLDGVRAVDKISRTITDIQMAVAAGAVDPTDAAVTISVLENAMRRVRNMQNNLGIISPPSVNFTDVTGGWTGMPRSATGQSTVPQRPTAPSGQQKRYQPPDRAQVEAYARAIWEARPTARPYDVMRFLAKKFGGRPEDYTGATMRMRQRVR